MADLEIDKQIGKELREKLYRALGALNPREVMVADITKRHVEVSKN